MTHIQNHKLEGSAKDPIPARPVAAKAGIQAFQIVIDSSSRLSDGSRIIPSLSNFGHLDL